MARLFWTKKCEPNSKTFEARTLLDNLEKVMQEKFEKNQKCENAVYGYLDSALSHWQANRCNISQAMDSACPPDNLLETVFSFQNDHVQIYINLEGAKANDVTVTRNREQGGFDIQVIHFQNRHPTGAKQAALRRVSRSYRLVRPCYWDQMEHSITPDGILQILVPGPPLVAQQIPMASTSLMN